MPHLVSISAVTLPTPPTPATATVKVRIFCDKKNKYRSALAMYFSGRKEFSEI